MKKIFGLVLAVSAMLFASCDNFEENEYMVRVEGSTTESAPITKTQTKQAVLLEDYTGWMCVNCPSAAALLETMITTYGEDLVAMSVHAGSFANPSAANNNLDFRTTYGTQWNSEFGFSAYPAGLVNRTYNGSSRIFQKDEWNSAVANLLSTQTHYMNINLGAKVSGKKIIVSAQYAPVANMDFPTYANIVVIESGIHGVQFNSDATYGSVPKIEDYVFNHVLRSNGLIALPLAETMATGTNIEKNYAINIDDAWVLGNCAVVVFVTNANTGEVVQVNEIEL